MAYKIPNRQTLRRKQMAPTAELLEEIYESLEMAEERILSGHHETESAKSLARGIRHTIGAVSLLADLVDRHVTRPEFDD